MSSRKQIEANRRNALKSTGPRTPEGKKISCLNALKHGVYSHNVVLPYEDHQAWEIHFNNFVDAAKPADAIEAALTRQLASIEWRMQRFDRMEAAHLLFRFNVGYRDEVERTMGPDRFPPEDEHGRISAGEGRAYNQTLKPNDRVTPNFRAASYLTNMFYKTLGMLESRRALRGQRGMAAPPPEKYETNPYKVELTESKELPPPPAFPFAARKQPVAAEILKNGNKLVKIKLDRPEEPSAGPLFG